MSATDLIRRALDTHGKLKTSAATLDVTDDLYAAGMTSHASVNVMLAIEDAFEIEFPDELLTKATFHSIASVKAAVDSLSGVSA